MLPSTLEVFPCGTCPHVPPKSIQPPSQRTPMTPILLLCLNDPQDIPREDHQNWSSTMWTFLPILIFPFSSNERKIPPSDQGSFRKNPSPENLPCDSASIL